MSDTITIPREEYEDLLQELEDLRDIQSIRATEARVAVGESEFLPIGMVKRLAAGDHPVRVWRDHRGLTLRQLGEKAGVSYAYLSKVERGLKPGSLGATLKLATALGVTVEDLVPEVADEAEGGPT